jgi:serine/threonine protein kinase
VTKQQHDHAAGDAQQFGGYELRERLGSGGMAEVWLARDPRGRDCVVKRILPHLAADADFVRMFLREAQISTRLRHPNIVEVHESGQVGGQYYLVMAYLRGRDLRTAQRALAAGGPIGFAAFVVHELLRALDYTHRLADDRGKPLKLVHRDVSPANVMLGFDGRVTLLDFGVAKAAADAIDLTQTGTLRGKIPYMAPEQMEGKKFDHRIDLFACGVVLHELCTGKRLFKGDSDMESIEKVRSAPVPLPSSLNPQVPQALDGICMKALARPAKDRYQSAREFQSDLSAVVSAERWGGTQLGQLMKQLFPDGEVKAQRKLQSADFASSTMKVKATTLLSRRATLVEKVGEPAYEQFMRHVADEIPFFRAPMLPSTQIPVADFLKFNDLLVDRFYNGDKRMYWTFGEQSGEWLSKNGPYVAQFQRGDYKRFWAILPAFWKTFYSEGEARVSSATESGRRSVLEIEIVSPVEHVYFEYSVLGFVKRGLEVLGARVRVERLKGFSSGDREIRYRFTIDG